MNSCFDQFGIECRAQADGLAKARGIDGRMAVQAFLVKNHRNSESRVLEEELLDGVGELGRLRVALRPPAASLGRPTWPMPWPLRKAALAFCEIEVAVRIDELRPLSACQTHIICAAFSSSVMRARRSFTAFFRGNSRIFICRQPRSFCRNCRPSRTSRLAPARSNRCAHDLCGIVNRSETKCARDRRAA